MSRLIRFIRRSLSIRLSFWVVLIVILIFLTSFGLMFAETRRVIHDEAWGKASESAVMHIDNTLHNVEVAANNMLVVIERNLDKPDMMFDLSRQVLESNPELTGCSISFEPYYYKEKGRYFSAYSYNDGDSIQTEQEGTDNYQYHCMDWYLIPKLLNRPYWIEPFQEDATEGIVVKDIFSSYSQPIHDRAGNVVGTFSVDICLNWFSQTISELKPYPNAYSILLGKGGTFLVHPDSTKLFYETIFTHNLEHPDSIINSLGESMIAGETGHRMMNVHGEPSYVFYKPFKNTGWSAAIICPESDVFAPYYWLVRIMRAIAIVGLLALLIFCYATVRDRLRPLRQLAHYTQLTAEGQFKGDVPDSNRPDEIGQLQRGFRHMQYALGNYIQEVRQQTQTLMQRNDELQNAYEYAKEDERVKTAVLHKMSDKMVAPVEEISAIAQEVSDYHMDMTEEEAGAKVNQLLADIGVVTLMLDEMLKVARQQTRPQQVTTPKTDAL